MTLSPRIPSQDHEALIINADQARRASLGRWVGGAGFAPRAVESPEKALAELEDLHCQLVLADLDALDPEGRAIFEELSENPLPVTGTSFVESVDARSGQPGLSRFGRLIGRSRPMQRIYDQLIRVAPTSATVFLVGESGTGKELTAELIHGLSDRATKPFVPINCGALSPGLIESELFGHERGSFTGADRRRPGLFEHAQGGTLFLDEITEMPLDLQVKLLRVLESGMVRRVGGQQPIEVDVRVITATNRDPEQAVKEKKLREDLFYRLMVFPVTLPPLRDRPDDVLLIARHYLELLNREGPTRKAFADKALEQMEAHSWPGNVRELRNAVERAFILADDEISTSCFSLDPLGTRNANDDDIGVRIGMPIAEAERRLILATLDRVQGDKKRTAKALGISLKTLYNRLTVYRAATASKP